ncbi:MAG: helix-turn-helix domain-containing protein [Chloroflexales bacterium]|nr:helix-turn-helix domain-containing protein [Chloroflexales bacterium]
MVDAKRHYKPRTYAVGRRLLALRTQAGLTQAELGQLLGVSKRSILKWEGGDGYPSEAHLQHLIEVFVARAAFTPGHERDEAEGLWAQVSQDAGKRLGLFNENWFAHLLAQNDERRTTNDELGQAPPGTRPSSLSVQPSSFVDWGEAIDVPVLYGREAELGTLHQWVLADRCRVVALLGLGGIGKTSVALSFARQAAANFQVVLFRSLRNAPPLGPLLDQLIWSSGARQAPPDGIHEKITLLVQLYRERRCLLVLDNFETLLQAGAAPGQYLAGYADYGALLQRLAESTHQSCLILTSREKPAELGPLEGRTAPVRPLLLAGLPDEACQPILAAKKLIGSGTAYAALARRYGGNPLALKLVSEPIQELFGGDISAFLANDDLFFNGVGALLDQQFMRSTPLEQAVLYWLAITRDLTPLDALIEHLAGVLSQREVLQALEALRRRLLIERGAGAPAFTLQPVIMEYVTARLVMAACNELINGQLALLCSHALVQATAKDYVRHSQEQLIAAPVLEQVVALSGGAQAGERRLADMLAQLRAWPFAEQRYGPGNIVNLLRLLRGSLRGLDLSRLAIRQAYLQETEAQDVRLNGAYLTQSVLAEAFEYGTCVALSPNGAYLAASTQSGEVRLWRVTDRTLVMSIEAHTGGTYGLALAADGQLLVSSAIDGTAKIWAAPSGRLLATLQGHIGGVNCVALTHDQRLVVSGGADGTLRLWDTSSAACNAIFHGHRDAVWDVAFAQHDQLLLSGSSDGTIKLWQTSSGQHVATLSGHAGPVWGVALAADSRLLASGGADGTVRLWDIERQTCLTVLQGHTGGVRGVALAADGRLLASGGMDRAIRLWDVSAALTADVGSEACLAVLEGHTTGVWDLALSADGQLLASASFDGTIRLWEPYSRTSRAVLQGHSGAIRTVMLAAHGQLLASGSFGGIIRLWEPDAQVCRLTVHAHDGMVFSVALSADQHMLASGGHDGMLRLWDARSGRPFATLRGHTDAICAVAWSADGAILASGSRDGTIRLWDAVSGACRATWQADRAGIRDIGLLADGGLLASASFGGSVGLWDVASGRSRWITQAHTGLVWRVALAGGGQLLASAGEDGVVRVWDVENGHCQATLVGHSGAVYSVALTADGRRAVSGGHDGTIRWWDTEGGTCLAIIERHSVVWNVALTADGRRAVSGEHDGTLRVWDMDTGVLLHTLRADRPYERMDITDLDGITEAQRASLKALGAVEQTGRAAAEGDKQLVVGS